VFPGAGLTTILAVVGVAYIAPPVTALDRLEWPGGTAALREVTHIPPHVTDDMLLVEVARTWYGVVDPLLHPSGVPARLIEIVTSSPEASAPGPVLPLPRSVWTDLLLRGRDRRSLGTALLSRRDAMLLYHGLMGMEPQTLEWFATRTDLLRVLLRRGAPAFATAAPAIRVENGVVLVPGGQPCAAEWRRLIDAAPEEPDEFIGNLMERRNGRLAWMFTVLASLDTAQVRFAIGERGEGLDALARHFVNASPEWSLVDRPFWRPAFGPAIPLLLIEPAPDGTVRGSDEFWRQVFDESDREWIDGSTPLTGPVLLDRLFGSEPYRARDRWVVFAFGQRWLARIPSSAGIGPALRQSQPFPALRVSLERIGIHDPALHLALYRAADRLSSRDSSASAGLAAWQGAAALVERSVLRGGLSAEEAEHAYAALAAMPMSAPRAEVTQWLLEEFAPGLMRRRGAPPSAERTVLRTIAGALTPDGPRVPRQFQWEDLTYAFVPYEVVSRQMETVRAAQGGPSLDDALAAWRAGGTVSRQRAEEIVARILPALVYAPHQAATDVPTLGEDLPFRHELVDFAEGPLSQKRRPWLVPRGNSHGQVGWHLEGSLLGLDLALHDWYVRRHGDPPEAAPAMDEPDLQTLLLANVLALTTPVSTLQLEEALSDLDEGKATAARLDRGQLDAALRDSGVDGWRRHELRLQQSSNGPGLTLSEWWRLGGAAGRLVSRWPLDGCACLGDVPKPSVLFEGRRSTGLIGSLTPDLALRVVDYLRAEQLPFELFGELMSAAVVDVVHGAWSVRPDDRRAFAVVSSSIGAARLEEHLLALIATGAMGRP
jgi:hypothetical protein